MGGATSYFVCLCTIFFAFLLERSAGQSTCTQSGTCVCLFTDGDAIDLTPLSKSGFPPAFNYKTAELATDFFQYAYNPCTGFIDPDSPSCNNVAVCQRSVDQTLHYNAGDPNTALFSSSGDSITYTSQGRVTNVELKCSQSANKPQYRAIGQQSGTDTYKLEITSCHCCKGGCTGSSSKSLGFGSILCIIFVVLLFVYLLGGVIFMRYVRGASGKEVIPNVGFWEEFPLLVKDGFVFVASCCKKDAAYESI